MKLFHLPFYLLLAAVCLAPLPFGAVQIGAWSALVLVIGMALAGWSIAVAAADRPEVRLRRVVVPLVAFSLVAAWIVVQLGTFTPEAWHHPIWSIARESLGVPLAGRVSIDPEAGWFGLIRLLAYGAVFWLAYQYGADAQLARRALRTFAIAGAAAAGVGVFIWSAGLSHLLWFDESFLRVQLRYGARLALPFVNPNHLAGFASFGLICTVGLIAGETRGLWRPETGRREKLRRFADEVMSRQWPLLIAGMVYVAAIVLSQSRGGLAALVVGLLVMWAALLRRSEPRSSRAVAIAALAIVATGLIFAPTVGRFADRIGKVEDEAVQRVEIYRNALAAIEASPMLGYGFGSFPALYQMYDGRDVHAVVNAAHSTILENTVELGIPAAMALFTAVLWPAIGCWRGAGARRRDQHIPALAAGVAAAAVIHSMVDFPLQIPAIASALSLVLGLGFAQSLSSRST
ncbi:MAG: O-antigen ligase family protein [Sphingomonadales bacterium]